MSDFYATQRFSEASNARWAKEKDRTLATEPGRNGMQRRFERCVDPDGILSPAERAKRVKNARQFYFSRIKKGGPFDWSLITAKSVAA